MKFTPGEKIGYWTVVSDDESEKSCRKIKCRCDCGFENFVSYFDLINNKTKKCRKCSGFLKRKYNYTENFSRTYAVYNDLFQRCYNKNMKYYHRYGGRGITVCDRWWIGFNNFLEDMGECPNGLTLDRIDNNQGYSKENCRWVDRKTQSRNRQNSIKENYISNGWFLKKYMIGHKLHLIECINCGFERTVLSCNFRVLKNHKCEVNHAAK